MTMNEATADLGLIGLAVMGQNLVLNMADNGYTVAVYNRTPQRTEEFLAGPAADSTIIGTDSLEQLVSQLKRPRRVMLMVQAGAPVDAVIDSLVPLLEPGDIIIDGGNSHYPDTDRRLEAHAKRGIRFVGAGISGGEEGARTGPSIMPGGDEAAWPHLQDIFEAIAARVDGVPCVRWLGPGGSGHYVKMVHNGIEYADMQLITEAYQFLREKVGLTVKEIADVFKTWNETELKSYLIEITNHILDRVDAETNQPIVDVILDKAGQKGTGKWTSQNALDIGVPSSIITESVFARYVSAFKEERVEAAKHLTGPSVKDEDVDKAYWIEQVKEALFMGKICAYAQGFHQYQQASEQYGWDLNLDEIALIFRGGCIIRADFLNTISDAFKEDASLTNLLRAPYFQEKANQYQTALRTVAIKGMENGLSLPCFSAALTYYDGYRSAQSGANLIQAQRDYFGAHTYERIDKEGIFHTEW